MVIYKITNKINNKLYVDKTINDREDYYGLCKVLFQTWFKYVIITTFYKQGGNTSTTKRNTEN